MAGAVVAVAVVHLLLLLLPSWFGIAVSAQSTAPKTVSTLLSNQSLADGELMVSSPGGVFVLGFFNPDGTGGSANRYLGIWYQYMKPQTVVWVANRENPIAGANGSLSISSASIDIYINTTIRWSTGALLAPISHCTLDDNGNFAALDASGGILWQSFDHITDTLLPRMQMGYVDPTKQKYLTSWRSTSDPSPGSYLFKLDPTRLLELATYQQNTTVTYRSGPWNGTLYNGIPNMRTATELDFSLTSNSNGTFYSFDVVGTPSQLWRLVMSYDGNVYRYISQGSSWFQYYSLPQDVCDNYDRCGKNGVCNSGQECGCLNGFKPSNGTEWDLHSYNSGCKRVQELSDCLGPHEFMNQPNIKLPDTVSTQVRIFSAFNDSQCRDWCLSNCSCTAYAMTYGGCTTWHGDLLDMQQFPEGKGDQLFVKVLKVAITSATGAPSVSQSPTVSTAVYVGVAVGSAALLVVLGFVWFRAVRSRRKQAPASSTTHNKCIVFELSVLKDATDGFTEANFLGRGLFGRVYKGTLPNGEGVAVKRLSPGCPQGLEQLRSEISSLANLSHRNLIKLIGFYIGEDEKLLCYEYMPNSSLDQVLFGKTLELDWQTRVSIIKGIADGLLYLHEEAIITVVHRDIKPNNILLAEDMSPKIADFGLSRLFDSDDQTTAQTMNIMGTLGYMAPEVRQGKFSTKSDVYSFGIVMLEIVVGQKNYPFFKPDVAPDLLTYVRQHWSEGMELITRIKDPRMGMVVPYEVHHFVQLALICCQEEPSKRPSMRHVMAMLSSDSVTLPEVVTSTPAGFTGTYIDSFCAECSEIQAR